MKKHLIKKLSAVVLSSLGLTALSFGAAGCVPKSTVLTEPDNIEITRLAPPTDGSLPTAHTCAENLAYITYVFDQQTQYHSYSYGVTSASIATQTTRTFRDYKDGVLLTTDLSYSSMVKNGTQTCTVVNAEGESEVYFRVCDAPEADTLPSQAKWSEDAPVVFSEYSYHYTYGLLPTELFNYIVNEQNIVDSEQVKVNPDGTYTQSFTLDPVASTYFYQFGMKTRGGLSSYPEFESITFSVTFDGDWRILSADMHEVSKINKGIVMTSVSDFNTKYWYGDDNFDEAHYSYYDSYYRQYIGDSSLEQGGSTDDKPVIDVTNILSNGFSQIMNGGAQFEITAQLGNNTYTGYVFASLDLADPFGTLALKLSLGKSLKEQTLFVEYGEDGIKAYYGKDFALTANLAEVKLAVGQLGETFDAIKSALFPQTQTGDAPATAAEDSDPLTALMDSMVLTAGEKQAVLTLDTDDLLGTGVGVSLRLVFGINNNQITFRGGTVGGLSVGGEALDVGLTIRTTTASEIVMPEGGNSADLSEYIADINSLLGSDLIKVTAGLHGSDGTVKIVGLKDIDLDLEAYIDLDGLTVGADAAVAYNYRGNKITASVGVRYNYNAVNGGWGEAVLLLTELNGSPCDIKLKCNIKEVYEALPTLLTFGGAQAGGSTDGLVKILGGVLSSDLSSLLTELRADGAQIKVGVSVDALLDMFNIDAGVKFGSCALGYSKGGDVYGGTLTAVLPALGFEMSVCGADGTLEDIDTDDCLDLIYVLDDVKSLINSDLLKAVITFDGGAEGVTVEGLDGLTAQVTAYLDTDGLAVAADLNVAYIRDGLAVSAELSAYYTKGESKYGELVLSLTKINGAPVNANVTCDIDELITAVSALLDYAGVQLQPFELGGGAGLEEIITNVLTADFGELIPVLSTDANGARLAVNADMALSLFGVNVGFNLGNISLAYNRGSQDMLVAKAPALGLGVTLGGAVGSIWIPSASNCLNLTQLVNTVQAVWEQVDGIIENKSLAFEIRKGQTYLALDGITVEIWGEGEVSWKSGGEYVALDLCASITERASDVVAIKLIYNKNATDTPLVRLALNGVGIDIYREDINSVTDGFNNIYSKIAPLLGLNDGQEEGNGGNNGNANGGESAVLSDNGTDKLLSLVFGIISSDSWVEVLNRFTVEADGKSVALSYLSENAASVEIKADGALELYYDGRIGQRFTLGGGITATSVTGSLVPALTDKFSDLKMSSSKDEGSATFTRLVYDYLFEVIDVIGVENILGSGTYTVTFALNGDNCNIAELDGINVNAQIYVTGEKGEQGKLAEANLDIDAAGVIISLNVIAERRGNTTSFYINLSQVADVQLPDLKFMATQDSLYDTLAVLIKTLNDTNVLDIIGGLVSNGGGNSDGTAANGTTTESSSVITDSTLDRVCDLISKLLNFNYSEAVVATEADGILTATIDLDNIVKQLGYQTGALGTVEAVINHNSHAIKTSGKTLVTDADGVTRLMEWISLSSELAPRRDYSAFSRADYISIEFLPTLIDDLVKFATDEAGNVHTLFTFSGTIKANVIGRFDLNIDVCTLTVGLKDGELTLSAIMHVQKVSVIGLVTIPESTVGITYQNGLLTLARGVDTATPEYKIMTFDYFIDHMLVKSGSVLQWLLNVDGWNMLMSVVNLAAGDLNISSGLTTTEDVYLYKAAAVKDEQEISMYDFVDAINVIIDGVKTASFGNSIADLESTLGVYDNYYGFALNAGTVTGGVLTKLCAALLRNDNGISGVKAAGAIQSYLSFSADLQYMEDWTDEYQLGTALGSGVTATSVYNAAMAVADEYNYVADFDHYVKKADAGYDEKFGCLSIAGGSNGYTFTTDYSQLLYTHVLTVVGLDGSVETRDVRHGSTVYFYDNYSPVFTDSAKSMRLLYSLSNAELGATSVVMNGDLTVYAVQRKAVTIVVHNGEETTEISSFAGDRVPVTVQGLETLSMPTYADGTPVGAEDIVSGEQSTLHIYGTFVKTEIVVNYVKYTFDAQTLSYTAAGKAAGFNDYYSVKGNTLVLENTIGGYPVTAIAAGAFANTEEKPISGIIVPENITTVGQEAFRDNYGMKLAVFLAETVKFEGSDGSSQTMPFYGCSRSSSDEKVGGVKQNEVTDLVVYYNNITTNGGDWRHFRYVLQVVVKYNFYIGSNGGATYSAGNWEYVDYTVSIDFGDVAGSTLSEQAVSDILAPYFPNFRTDEFVGSADEAAVERALEDGLTQFEILRGGIIYHCSVTTDIVRSGNKLTVNYHVSYKATAQISVYSQCSMTYNGVAVGAGAITQVNATVNDGAISLSVPKSDCGYVFLGWAVEKNGAMQFVGPEAEGEDGVVYYAVWGASKVGATVTADINYSGSVLSAPSSGNGKWYDDSWNEVTQLTKENTVVYTRQYFTVTVNVNKGLTDRNNLYLNGTKVSSISFTVLEGNVNISIQDKVLTVSDGVTVNTVEVKEINWLGKESGNRNIQSGDVGYRTVDGNFTVTLSY